MVVGEVKPEAMLEGAGSAYWRWNVVTFAYWMTARSIQKCPHAVLLAKGVRDAKDGPYPCVRLKWAAGERSIREREPVGYR